MKRKFQNGISVFVTLVLLFSLIPCGVMAEDILTQDENVVREADTLTQTETTMPQSNDISSIDPNADQTVQVNANDVSIEVTMTATNSLKNDVGKAMIDLNISDYTKITTLKINASSNVEIGNTDSSFICEKLVNLRILDLSNIESVSFPELAFRNCQKLEEVVLQDGAIISYGMFYYCTSLKSINLSNTNPNLGSLAFFGCSSLAEIVLPYGATINKELFGNCTALKSIDLSNAAPEIGYFAFHDCSSLEKVILPQNTILSGKNTFLNCRLLDDINWDAIKSYNGNYDSSGSTDFRNCAFDFSKGYPTENWDNIIYSYDGQIPKLYFSLAQTSYTLNLGESFSIPTPLFKTKNGTDYKDLEKYKSIYSDWLNQNTSYLQKTTYNTTITYNGSEVSSIDTSKPGEYQITYNLLRTTYADTHTLTCNVTVSGNEKDLITGIYLNQTNATMSPSGESLLLTATIEPEGIPNKTVIWSSSNESIATVNESGRVTAVKDGMCTISATIEGYTATCQITVKSTINPSKKIDVKFTNRYQDGFKANSLSAERIGNKIVFNLDYYGNRNCDYSFFNPPNGSIIMKVVKNGIKSGSNTLVLELTMSEFKKVLESSSITMKFGFDNRSSWIYFLTPQLSSLATQEELDNISDDESDSDYTYTYISGGVSITKYTGSERDVVIPDTLDGEKVLEIGAQSFASNNSITNLTIPDSVTCIGICSFESCTNLTTINIPNSVTTIDNSAFYKCSSLKTIKIPDSVSVIGPQAFEFCSSLTKIDIPDSVTTIEIAAFGYCSNLATINIPDSVTSIGRAAFNGCSSLKNIDIPDSVTEIGQYAFSDCSSLSTIQINSADTNIYSAASTIPQNTTIIGYNPSTAKDYAQKYNRIFKEIENTNVLPSSITLNKNYLTLEINDSEKLVPSFKPSTVTNKTISWSSSNPKIATVDPEGNVKGVAEGTAIITAMTVNGLSAKCNITIKKTADYTDIFTYSLFEDGIIITGCTSDISDISIPETIEDKPVTSIADWAFSDCTTLNTIVMPQTLINIGEGSFSGCTNLTSVSLPETMTTIGAGAFRLCVNLSAIDLPDNISYLGEGAFYSCKSLTSINLPSNITTLYANTFKDCTNLKTITIPDRVNLVGNAAFLGCSSLETIQFSSATTKIVDFENVIPSSATIIGYNPSTAKDYAAKYNRTFVEINEDKTLKEIAITSPAQKLVYKVGETLDLTGLSVIGTYSDGTTRQLEFTSDNILGFDTSYPETNQVLTIAIEGITTTYTVQIIESEEPIENGLTAFLLKDVNGNFYEYSKDEINYSFVVFQMNPELPRAKMYQHFSGILAGGGKVVGLKDANKGYMDYEAAVTAFMTAQFTGKPFEMNSYLALNSTKKLAETVANVQVIDKDGNNITNAPSYSISFYPLLTLGAKMIRVTLNVDNPTDYRVTYNEIELLYDQELGSFKAEISNATSERLIPAITKIKENNESPYSSILQEYRVAEANGFSQSVIKTLPNVNTELYGSSYKTKLYYILEDISGDSSPELVIAMYNPKYNNSVHPNDFQIYDVYRLNNGAPERIFDIYTMGYRSIYTICENQIIRCYGSGGINAHGDTFYKLDGNTATTIQNVTYDNPYYILNDAKNNSRTITKAEADRIINSYIPRTDINWIKL